MDTSKMRSELRVSAERAVASNPSGGDGNPFPALAIRAVDVLALLEEIEQLRDSYEQVCGNYNRVSFASEERGEQIDQLKAENKALRKIISESAAASGAAVSVECSLEFMSMLPAEIGSVVGGLRKDAERYRFLREGGYLHRWTSIHPCDVDRESELTDRAIDMAREASHG